jgi:hypothetical protein
MKRLLMFIISVLLLSSCSSGTVSDTEARENLKRMIERDRERDQLERPKLRIRTVVVEKPVVIPEERETEVTTKPERNGNRGNGKGPDKPKK